MPRALIAIAALGALALPVLAQVRHVRTTNRPSAAAQRASDAANAAAAAAAANAAEGPADTTDASGGDGNMAVYGVGLEHDQDNLAVNMAIEDMAAHDPSTPDNDMNAMDENTAMYASANMDADAITTSELNTSMDARPARAHPRAARRRR